MRRNTAALRVKSLRYAVQQRSDSNLAPLCGTAASRQVPTSQHVPHVISRPSVHVPHVTSRLSRHIKSSRPSHITYRARPPSRHVSQDYTSPSWPPFDPAHPACIPRPRLDAAGLGQQSDFESRTTWTAARLGQQRNSESRATLNPERLGQQSDSDSRETRKAERH